MITLNSNDVYMDTFCLLKFC